MAEAKCKLVTAVSVCVSVPRRVPTLLHGPGCNLGNDRGCPLVVHCQEYLQSVDGFRCYDNIATNAKYSLWTYAWFLLVLHFVSSIAFCAFYCVLYNLQLLFVLLFFEFACTFDIRC